MSEEAVNSPAHYNKTELECIDAIRYALGDEGFIAYCKGNALKYTWRSGHKIDSVEDLKKAAWYCRMAAGDDPRKDTNYDRSAPIKDLQVDLTDLNVPKPGSIRVVCECRSCRGHSASRCPAQPFEGDDTPPLRRQDFEGDDTPPLRRQEYGDPKDG